MGKIEPLDGEDHGRVANGNQATGVALVAMRYRPAVDSPSLSGTRRQKGRVRIIPALVRRLLISSVVRFAEVAFAGRAARNKTDRRALPMHGENTEQEKAA
jgi:hypothetical protein